MFMVCLDRNFSREVIVGPLAITSFTLCHAEDLQNCGII